MEFGFSFDAAPTIDMVLYFGGSTKEDRDRWRRLRDTSSSRTNYVDIKIADIGYT